jgi:CDP-diacylglycerol--serine O-phosphatidyltransferase
MSAPQPPRAQEPGQQRFPWRRRRRRRRRTRAERQRGFVSILPSLLTTGNLAAGFWSITLSMHAQAAAEGARDAILERAALAIMIGGLFDAADGRVARLANATSRFGAQYDSISDTVSFGVAPAILAYSAASLPQLGWAGWVIAFLYTACAGMRLARFNVSPGRFSDRFDGLPSPPAAGMMLSSVWFGIWLREQGLPFSMPPWLAGIGVALVALLMVSPIPYHSFKHVRFAKPYRALVLLVIAISSLLIEPKVTFFCVGIVYLASGPIEYAWRWKTGRILVPDAAHPQPQSHPVPAEPGSGAAQ